jgi:hypothetical protein
MSLGVILTDIASIGGIDLSDPNQLVATTYRVNKAAKEIYEQNDLIGSQREQVMQMTAPKGDQFSMPEYVGQIKAVRYFYPEFNLKTVDMRPRYKGKYWQVENFMSWRLKEQSPIRRQVSNAGPVLIRPRQKETQDVTVTLSGWTENASNIIENLVFPAGYTGIGLQSQNAFLGFTAITKSVATLSDFDVWDLDGNLMSTLANNQLKALYQLVQIINMPNGSLGAATFFQPITDFVEVLWKMKWRPMVTPQDEFLCPAYDEAIFWKYMEHKARVSPQSTFDANQADKFKAKCDELIKNIANQNDENLEMSLNFGTNATYGAFENISEHRERGENSHNRYYDGSYTIWP